MVLCFAKKACYKPVGQHSVFEGGTSTHLLVVCLSVCLLSTISKDYIEELLASLNLIFIFISLILIYAVIPINCWGRSNKFDFLWNLTSLHAVWLCIYLEAGIFTENHTGWKPTPTHVNAKPMCFGHANVTTLRPSPHPATWAGRTITHNNHIRQRSCNCKQYSAKSRNANLSLSWTVCKCVKWK